MTNPISLSIDHASLAVRDLDELVQPFRQLGLDPVYGGAHSNGATHMAVLGFSDGSYLELISTLQPGQPSPWWQQAIHESAGPCAWAVRAQGIQAEAVRLAGLGVAVRGPTPLSRRRPDGALVEWELAFLGPGEPGSTLPFLIEDRTPRDLRVQVTPSTREAGLLRIGKVVLGVRAIEPVAHRFRELYGWSAPRTERNAAFGARLADFPGQPVLLAEPLDGESWLAERLARLGETLCALILTAADLAETSRRLGLPAAQLWFGTPLAWLHLPGDQRVAVMVE